MESGLNLDKLRKVLSSLKDPQKSFRSIHVAGTKGKGSVCTFISSILERSGHSVGLFTSPHITDVSERIKVNSEKISEQDTVKTFELLRPHLGEGFLDKFTFFEVYTLMAILHFSMKKVDFAVLETGLGGRLDATNVIDAEISAITPISYDHMDVLGNSLEEIAREKAGIIKQDRACVSAEQNNGVLDVIKKNCVERSAGLSVVGTDVKYDIKKSDEKGNLFDIKTGLHNYQRCRTSLLGDFQAENCAMAVGVCEKVLDKIDPEKIAEGIENVFIPGRMETVGLSPRVVIDGAQNGDSMRRLRKSVEQIFKYDRLILILGISNDKDVKEICREIGPVADSIILTSSSSERALDPSIIRGYIRRKDAIVTHDTKEALGIAFSSAGKNDLILAAGSFYLIGEVRKKVKGQGSRSKGQS